jgi:hypothetical protein
MRKGRDHTRFLLKETLMGFLIVCVTAYASFSQEIRNVDFDVAGSSVRISYDITGCSGGKTYDLKLFLGTDGELIEISQGLSGDLKGVTCGSSRMILWDVLSERDELKGRVYFTVVIHRIREEIQVIPEKIEEPDVFIQEPETNIRDFEPTPHPDEQEKPWTRRSWKDDKGYVGGSIGMFTPYENHSIAPYSPRQNGFFLNATFGYLPSLLLGLSTTIFFHGAPQMENLRITSWMSYGIMIGPLLSLPIGNKIKWELRAQVGYARIFPLSDQSDPASLDTKWSGVASNLGTGFRLNFGKRTCYMVNVEYQSATREFDDFRIESDLKLFGASFGIAFRLY